MFSEADQTLEKEAKVIDKTGILVSAEAKKVKTQIEDSVKLLWKFGSGLYENGNFHVNLTINTDEDEDVDDQNIIASKLLEENSSEENAGEVEFADLGIYVKMPVNKLLRKFKANIAQVMVYEKYPLLSVQSDNVSPHFVSIKLSTSDGKEVPVTNIDDPSMLPEIRFSHNVTENAHSSCLCYDED